MDDIIEISDSDSDLVEVIGEHADVIEISDLESDIIDVSSSGSTTNSSNFANYNPYVIEVFDDYSDVIEINDSGSLIMDVSSPGFTTNSSNFADYNPDVMEVFDEHADVIEISDSGSDIMDVSGLVSNSSSFADYNPDDFDKIIPVEHRSELDPIRSHKDTADPSNGNYADKIWKYEDKDSVKDSTKTKYYLKHINIGQIFNLYEGYNTICKGVGSYIITANRFVSSSHSVFFIQNDVIKLIDASTNGIYVNDNKFHNKSVDLRTNDIIFIDGWNGNLEAIFVLRKELS